MGHCALTAATRAIAAFAMFKKNRLDVRVMR